MWIVMTSCAKMPSSCKGTYRNVAMAQLDQHYTAHNLVPKMISEHARGVLSVRHLGYHSVGKTDRCAYRVALRQAQNMCAAANNAGDVATAEQIIGAGGSA